MRNLFLTLFVVFLLNGCQSRSEQQKLQGILVGDWLVLGGDHQLDDEQQREAYGKIQDSVIESKSLKLVSFEKDGNFTQLDELPKKGKWAVSPSSQVYIANGGEGFDDFKSEFTLHKDNVLQLTEYLRSNRQTIKVTWHFKKVKSPELFKEEKNKWRKRASRPETEPEIRKRLSDMLAYYSAYLFLVEKESSFFIVSRIVLPLKFYQHAMSTLPYKPGTRFANLFFTNEQSEQAHSYLKKTIYNLGNQYPQKDNYVTEYASFLALAAEVILR